MLSLHFYCESKVGRKARRWYPWPICSTSSASPLLWLWFLLHVRLLLILESVAAWDMQKCNPRWPYGILPRQYEGPRIFSKDPYHADCTSQVLQRSVTYSWLATRCLYSGSSRSPNTWRLDYVASWEGALCESLVLSMIGTRNWYVFQDSTAVAGIAKTVYIKQKSVDGDVTCKVVLSFVDSTFIAHQAS